MATYLELADRDALDKATRYEVTFSFDRVISAAVNEMTAWLDHPDQRGTYGYGGIGTDFSVMNFYFSDPDTAFDFRMRWT